MSKTQKTLWRRRPVAASRLIFFSKAQPSGAQTHKHDPGLYRFFFFSLPAGAAGNSLQQRQRWRRRSETCAHAEHADACLCGPGDCVGVICRRLNLQSLSAARWAVFPEIKHILESDANWPGQKKKKKKGGKAAGKASVVVSWGENPCSQHW